MRKKKFGIIRKRIFSLLLATMMVSSSALTVFATDDLSLSDGATTEITEQIPEETGVTEEIPEETGVPEETPEETGVTEEIPEETGIPEEIPEETGIPEETPEETGVTEETPEETGVIEEIPENEVIVEHFISDAEGEGLLPYEYYVIECVEEETDDGAPTRVETSKYYSSYSSSYSRYSSLVGYNSLTTDQKKAYDALYDMACTIDESAEYDAEYISEYGDYYFPQLQCSIPIADVDKDSLFTVYMALKNDNPQFFWLGHGYLSWKNSTNFTAIQFLLDAGSVDYADGDARMQVKEELFAEIESVLEGAEDYDNEYSKEWYIHNYLCEQTVYDLEGPHAHDISGLILDQRAVCESYAKCFQLFMNALDIDVMYITGDGNGGGHAWNQIGLENNGVTEWYNIDVTWDDDEEGGWNYNYFNVVDSDGTIYDFTKGYVSGGILYNEHTPKTSGDKEYVYSAKKCTSTTFSYKNHAKNFKLASKKPVAKIGETEYTSLESALDAATEGDTITLLCDVVYNDFDMPEYAIIIDCAGYVMDFENDMDNDGMDLNADLTIKNVCGKTLEELGITDDIYSNDFDYIYLNGNTLTFEGTWEGYLPVYISGYLYDDGSETGTVCINTDDNANILRMTGIENIQVEEGVYANISFGFDTTNAILADNAVLNLEYGCGEIGSLDIADTACLNVSTDDKIPAFIIFDEITGDVVTVKAANMEEGLATIVTRIKYSVDKFRFIYVTDEGETDRYITRIAGNGHYLYGPFLTADFTISDGTDSVKRCTFSEAVEYIVEQNDATADYTITYDGEGLVVTNDFTFGNAKSITFDGNPIVFDGNITLNTNIVFETGVTLNGDLSGEGKKVTFASGDAKSEIYCPNINGVNITVDNCEVSFKDKKAIAENVISIPTFTLKGNTDVRFEGIDKISIATLDTNGDNNTMYFNKGKVEIGNVLYHGLTTFSIGNGDVLDLTGSISIYNSKKIIIHSESATRNDKIMTVDKDLSNYFVTEMTNTAGVPFSVVYRNKALVYDVPVYRLEGVGIFSEWSDILAYINKNGSAESEFEITLLCDAEISKLTLPAATKAKSVTFSGEDVLTIDNTTLSVPIDTYFNCELTAEKAAFTVSAKKTLSVTDATIKSITGTTTSDLSVGTLDVTNVKTFDTVDATEMNLAGDMSGIKNFSGNLYLTNPESEVDITNITQNSVFSYNTGDELPDVTVNGISEEVTLTINVNDGAPITSGTVILRSSSDIADEDYKGGLIVVENTDENGEELKPYFYSSNKVIKAESPEAITLSYGENVKKLPSYDKVVEIINSNRDKTIDYNVEFNTPVIFKSLTIPTYAKSITFSGEHPITYTGTTLKLPINTYFDCELIAENTSITPSKELGLSDATVKNITGLTTSKLFVIGTVNAQNVKTFASVDASEGELVVKTNITVTKFAGNIKANTSRTVVTITNAGNSNITMVSDSNGKLGKVTLKGALNEAVISVRVVDENGETVQLSNSTVVLYTAGKDLSGYVSIINKTVDDEALTAFYYSKTKSIKAEWAGAIKLHYNDTETDLPNIEKVLEKINANRDRNANYDIELRAPLKLSSFTTPTYVKTITFSGDYPLTYTGTTLRLPKSTYFDCELIAEKTAITASKDLGLADATVKNITGTTKSKLFVTGTVNAQNVKTFASVDATAGKIVAKTNVTVTKYAGNIEANTPKTAITIAKAENSNIYLVSDGNGKVGKTTVNSVTDDAVITVCVIDVNGNIIPVSGGTNIMYSSKDISENVKILNKMQNNGELKAYYYGNNIVAEWPFAVTLSYMEGEEEVSVDYSNVYKAFEAIDAKRDPSKDYTISFNVTTSDNSTLKLPTYANSVTFAGRPFTYEGSSLKLPVDTIFECEFIAPDTSITTLGDVTFRNFTMVKNFTGSKTSVLSLENGASISDLKTFAEVNVGEDKTLYTNGTVSGIGKFYGNIDIRTTKANVTITEAGDMKVTLIADENDKFGKLTINKVSDGALVNIEVDDETENPIHLLSNTPIVYSSSDISGSVNISNTTTDGEYPLVPCYSNAKKLVYAGYEEAVEARYVDGNGELQNKHFTSLEEALAYIPSNPQYARINLKSDIRVEKLSIPKYSSGLEIFGNGNHILLDNVSTVSASGYVGFYNVTMDSTRTFKISTTDYISFNEFRSSTLTSVSGKSTKSVAYSGDLNNINYSISGFGTIELLENAQVSASRSINVKNVIYNDNAVLSVMPGSNLKFTNISPFNSDSEMPLTICYYDGTETPVTILGVVNGNILLKHQSGFVSGQQLFKASKANLSKFAINENSIVDGHEYILKKISGNIYIKALLFEVSDGTDTYKYADWSDFVSKVNSKRRSTVDYTVKLLDNYNSTSALTMPKAGYYSS
ncbi:MAG: hypothetical protein J5992_07800, partial [Oscillospiraceae bacterium]|nr:hypothetical protein [Oscillospiraceae bacterium]